MKILILNGPNLNMLGIREPDVYGSGTYVELIKLLESHAEEIGTDIQCRQTNHEGVLVDWIQEAMGQFDAIIINPAAYTHTSVAIADAIKAVRIPTVEVHISDVDSREAFRRISYVSAVCIKTVKGKGFMGYVEAMDYLNESCQ